MYVFLGEMVMTVMAMATVSVISAMLTIFIHFKGSAHRVPKWLRIVVFKGIARILCLKHEVDAIESVLDADNAIKPFDSVVEDAVDIKPKPQSELGAILKHLQMITEYLNEKKADDAVTDEWKLLAKIIDRLFFWVSLIVLVIAVIVIAPK